jgi:endoglucanase
MKKIAAAAVLLFTVSIVNAQAVKLYGQLKVQGTSLTGSKGESVVLHGMSFGWHNLWPRFYNAGAVHELVKKWNCTVLRASMGIELNDSGYLKNPGASTVLMKNVIEACIKEGVYVIIDWHDHNIHLKEAKVFFEMMAKQYGHQPNVIYELYNEPDYETWPEVKAYATELIKIIRATDPDNIILVGSPRWDQDIQLPAADPITGFDNLMYTMHFYAGTHKQWLRNRTDEAISKGLPVFISECAGMEATGDGPIDYAEWQKYIDWMDAKGLSWVAWSVSDKNETCSVLRPTASSTGNWKEEEIKEYGIKAREYLWRYPAGKKGKRKNK